MPNQLDSLQTSFEAAKHEQQMIWSTSWDIHPRASHSNSDTNETHTKWLCQNQAQVLNDSLIGHINIKYKI